MAAQPPERPAPAWRKSRASDTAETCVEMAIEGSSVMIRDSRDQSGTVLVVTSGRWRDLIRSIRNGEFSCD
jgi:Domain of unknown function (DUF397)